jgi:hypothetical protein
VDGSKQADKKGGTSSSLIRTLEYVVGAVLCVFAAIFALPGIAGELDGGERLLLAALLLCPLVQLARLPLLRRLLSAEHWRKRTVNTAATDWFISLLTGALMAFPLINLAIHGGYTGSLFITRQWSGYWYEQFWIGDHEIGIPDYFAALILAILVDILVLWAFALFRKRAFKPSLRAALIVNAAIYVPVTLLFLMPYFAHKIG